MVPEASWVAIYRSADGVDLRLWLFEPDGHTTDDHTPAVVFFFFGGGWSGGSPTQFVAHSKYLVSCGMAAMPHCC